MLALIVKLPDHQNTSVLYFYTFFTQEAADRMISVKGVKTQRDDGKQTATYTGEEVWLEAELLEGMGGALMMMMMFAGQKYLSDVRLFTIKVTVIEGQAVQPGGAVKGRGRNAGRKGGGGLQGVIGLGERRPWGNIFLKRHEVR